MVFLLIGQVHAGKTNFLKKFVLKLEKEKVPLDGFLSESIREGNEILGYNLFELKTKKRFPFIRPYGNEDWERIGPFFFIPQTLERARGIILASRAADLLIVDEVGPLEIEGKGFWPALQKVLFDYSRHFLLIARASIFEELSSLLGKTEIKVFATGEENLLLYVIRELYRAPTSF